MKSPVATWTFAFGMQVVKVRVCALREFLTKTAEFTRLSPNLLKPNLGHSRESV